jgi:pimeloyl-ACP methyl ester carboxylesterase
MPFIPDSNSAPGSSSEARLLIERIAATGTRHDVVHGGIRVCWRRFGAEEESPNPPLVLLHGGHGSWMHWLRNVEALSAGRTLWLPDLPGFNDSDAPPHAAPGEDPLGPLLADRRRHADRPGRFLLRRAHRSAVCRASRCHPAPGTGGQRRPRHHAAHGGADDQLACRTES